tara:strand:- start:2391 stop:2813 length:423 start_codon:yes stop_codon:yes gene_type:complete
MNLRDRVMEHEGYRDTVYRDSLDKRTVGVGHLCVEDFWEDGKKYDKKFLMKILDEDLEKAHQGAMKVVGHIEDLPREIWEVIVEMVFQLGSTGVKNFKKFIKALEDKDYHEAHLQMKDSRWHRQTKKRCESLAEIVKSHA